jgi:hypothetical protein
VFQRKAAGRAAANRERRNRASAGDAALALALSAVVVEGSKAGQRGGLLAADVPGFRHADDEGNGGARADAGDAEDKIEAHREIVVGAQPPGDAPQLAALSGGQCRW